jgi:Ca-activated chloride channel homolog
MRRTKVFLWAVVFTAASCGPSLKGDVHEGKDGAVKIAGQGGGSQRTAYNAPAHEFTPRQHGPHGRAVWAGPGDLSALPPLRMDLEGCFGVREEEKSQIAKPPSGGTKYDKGKDSSAVHKGGAKKPTEPKKEPTPKSGHAKSSPSYPSGAGGGGGGAGLDDMTGGASMGTTGAAPSQPSAPYSPPPSYSQPTPNATPSAGYAAPSSPPAAQAPSPDVSMSISQRAEEKSEAAAPSEIAESPRDEEQKIAGGEAEQEAPPTEYEDWGAEIYLSNDDSMSLSSAQRVMFAIDNFLPLPLEHIRPHELLNYFAFETQEVGADDDFSVLADVAADPREAGIYTLALSVRGRPVTKETRRNVALTWVVDRSGSMQDEGRMEYLKQGLARSLAELKPGDVVNIVAYDHTVCTPVEGFVVGRDDVRKLERAIDLLEPRGSTDLHAGLTRGYEIADSHYLPEHSNRVILISDALANTGVTDESIISTVSKYYDQRRIRLSGVGVGTEFNDALLDKLTERGKGAYVFLGSAAEVDAVFGPRFISLVETTALDVHFLLHLPQSLRMNVFYGEESSTVKEDVQAIHYFANTSQLFLSDLMARGGALRGQDDVMLSIEYEDPETGADLVEEYAYNLGEIERDAYNIKKGRLVMAWIDLVAQMAMRPVPAMYASYAGAWQDPEAWQACEDGRDELRRLGEGLESDPESQRVQELWGKLCSRFERPRNPVKRKIAAPDPWPGAQPTESPR